METKDLKSDLSSRTKFLVGLFVVVFFMYAVILAVKNFFKL